MSSTSVKTIHYLQPGAPQLPGTPAALISVLNAFLVDGFGLKTLDSVEVQDEVATAVCTSGFSFDEGSVALLAGNPAVNGERRVTKVLSTTKFQFAAPGVSNGTLSGTITAKMAPLGWERPFSTTNTAVYRSADPASTRCYLRVDDSAATAARVFGYEEMTDVSTGTGQFPLAAQVPGGLYWGKSSAANSVTRPWLAFGDERTFYIWVSYTDTDLANPRGNVYGFGDLEDTGDADTLGCFIAGSTASNATTYDPVMCMGRSSLTQGGVFVPRDVTNIGGARPALRIGAMTWNNTSSAYSGSTSYTSGALVYPNRGDNSAILSSVFCVHDQLLRGAYPGIYHTPQDAVLRFSHLDPVPTIGDLAGRTVRSLKLGQSATAGPLGVMFYDATGPWR